MEYQHGPRVGTHAATILFFLTFFFLPHFGYGEVENPQSHRADPVVPGQFIVVLNGGFDPAQVAFDHAAVPLHLYRVASRGFAARLSNAQANALRSDPRVNNVVADRKVTTAAKPGTGGGGGTVEVVPTGIKRIDAEGVAATDEIEQTIVAIIDTGIDLDHPDLNVSSTCGFSAYNGTPDDGNGHGTHVAGTVGAIANTSGVRGVAPGVELCPVKVLDNSGSGTWSSIITGIDYVTDRRREFNDGSSDGDAGINIKVANMSLGGCANVAFIWCVAEPPPGNNSCGVVNGIVQDPLHQAICNSTAAGVVYSVAAGNDGEDALYFVPAAYPEVITVSAIADYNGKGGGGAKAPRGCNYGPDDSLASFSNHGATVAIAAPGACILSTYKGGGTKTLSGTSMATPHVTGAISLASFEVNVDVGDKDNPRNAAMFALLQKSQGSYCGFSGDPDASEEPVVYVGQPDTDCGLIAP
ncbi:MAG TPA: S8 family serine peptidase [Candidatus Binatia bacterium]